MTDPITPKPSTMPTSYIDEKATALARMVTTAIGRWDGFAPVDSTVIRDARFLAESLLAEFDKWGVDHQGAYPQPEPEPPAPPTRKAVINTKPGYERFDATEITALLPSNYRAEPGDAGSGQVTVVGNDVAGWTLDGYVIPRLGSALIIAREVTP